MASNNIFERQPESWFQRFLARPSPLLAGALYSWRQHLLQQSATHDRSIAVVCISDTHNKQPTLPDGDFLVHAGDLTERGTKEEMQKQLDWIESQPHKHKFVIAGNHDIVLDLARSAESNMTQEDLLSLRWGSINYLERTCAHLRVDGRDLTVFGHPSTPRQGNWAFQHDRHEDVFSERIPRCLDILLTHSPPRYHLDLAGQGDEHLLIELWRTRPRIHVFGHLHAGYGCETLVYDYFTMFYEEICAGTAGNARTLFLLFVMAVLLAKMYIVGIDANAQTTHLVNAAVVGGHHNEIKNKAHVVYI